MSMQELKALYGGKKKNQIINAAIRAELPGGSELLNLLGKTNQIFYNATDDGKLVAAIFTKELKTVKKAMEREIYLRYDLKDYSEGDNNEI